MSAEVISMADWKAERLGRYRQNPAHEELASCREEADWARQRIAEGRKRIARIGERLESGITLSGPNKGKPITDGNRYQLENERRNLVRHLGQLADELEEHERSIEKLEEDLQKSE